jgi:hypothetical protein
MKRISTALSLSVVAGLFVLVGCKTAYDDIPPPGPSPVTVAKQVCEISALAEERDTLIEAMDADYPEATSTAKEHRWTILKDKLRDYRAEIDASYRFVTASCNSYSLCMENNGYQETSCTQTRQAWVDSQEKFNRLAVSLNGKPWRKHRGRHGGRGDGCYGGGCDSLGGYSQDCCYDGD